MDRSSRKACASSSTPVANAALPEIRVIIPTDAQSATPSIPCMKVATTTCDATKTDKNPSTVRVHSAETNLFPIKRTADNNSDARPLPTPTNVDILRKYLHGYDPTARQFLLDGFSHGFDMGDNAAIINSAPENSSSINLSHEQVRAKIVKEDNAGRMAVPFTEQPFEPFHISPIGLRPQKVPGQYRLIHDLSFPYDDSSINFNIPKESKQVKYCCVSDAIKIIHEFSPGAHAAKTDIENALKLIPIKPELYPKLGIKFDNLYYYDKTLPQGCASSCHIFEKFSTAIQWILQQRVPGIRLQHYIDDFIVIAKNEKECENHLHELLSVCGELGVPMAPDKTTKPATVITFLGIELDLDFRVARLPNDKLSENIELLTLVLSLKKIRKKTLDSLIGKLCFATSVVPGRAFLRRLYNKAAGVHSPSHFIKISKSMRADLETWLNFLLHYNGVSFFRLPEFINSTRINMCSDASKLGFGATYGTHWIQGQWPKGWTKYHITVLEFFPVFVLVSMFAHLVKNANILYYCDNIAVVEIINKQISKNKKVMDFLRPLVLIMMRYNINLRSKHIPGVDNVLCDKISRFQVSPGLLQLYGMRLSPTPIPHHLQPRNSTKKWTTLYQTV